MPNLDSAHGPNTMPGYKRPLPRTCTCPSLPRFTPYWWTLLVLAVWWSNWTAWAQDATDEAEFARQLPAEAKQHVYLFFLNGIDPLEFGQLSQLRDFCQELGFAKSWYGQFYHRWYFQRVIEDIVHRDAEARFVIVGFSAGALAARDLASSLNQENIPVDLLVYIGGATLTNSPRNRPNNVRRLLHIRANDWIFRGWAIEGAENIKCEDVWHFGTPNHPETRRRIAEALAQIAGRVPVVQLPAGWPRALVPQQWQEPAQTEHKRAIEEATFHAASQSQERANEFTVPCPQRGALSPAWDFLRATRQLRPVPPPDYSGLPYQSISKN